MPWIAGAVGLAAAVILGVVLATGGGDSGPTGDEALADADAKSIARTSHTALETWATDNNGSYAGATAADLAALEPAIDESRVTVESADSSFTITARSTSGNEFTVTRDRLSGATILTCTEAGTGGCPASGNW